VRALCAELTFWNLYVCGKAGRTHFVRGSRPRICVLYVLGVPELLKNERLACFGVARYTKVGTSVAPQTFRIKMVWMKHLSALLTFLTFVGLIGTQALLLAPADRNGSRDIAKIRARLTPVLTEQIEAKGFEFGAPVFLRIFKEERE